MLSQAVVGLRGRSSRSRGGGALLSIHGALGTRGSTLVGISNMITFINLTDSQRAHGTCQALCAVLEKGGNTVFAHK